MPDILEKCVEEVMAKGHDKSSAISICKVSVGMAKKEGKEGDESFIFGKATELCDEMKNKEYSLETYDLKDQEIFASGVWNGDKYTEKDLDAMVSSFNETSKT